MNDDCITCYIAVYYVACMYVCAIVIYIDRMYNICLYIYRNFAPYPLSQDHKPSREDEAKRSEL